MRKIALFSLLAFLLLSGCSRKEYFKPSSNEISGAINPTSIGDKLTTANGDVATFKSGNAVDKKNRLKKNTLSNTESIIAIDGKMVALSGLDGEFKIIKNNKIIYERRFKSKVVAASMQNDDLALITAQNIIYLIKIPQNSIISFHKIADVYAQDARVKAPIFLEDIVVYPTLDGKIYLIDRRYGGIIRTMHISSEPFFNNIIFLDIDEDSIYAATGTKLMQISQKRTKVIDGDIKIVLKDENFIYALMTNGEIRRFDRNLNLLNSAKFDFAIFTNATIKDGNLYVLEKMGYLIKLDSLLQNHQIYKIGGKIKDKTFSTDSSFYIGSKKIEIE